MSALIELIENEERGPLPAWEKPMLLRADPDVVLARHSRKLLAEGISSLESFPVPVLLIVGAFEDEEDDAARVAAAVPRGESLTLPRLGHSGAFNRSDLVLPTARAFLDRWLSPDSASDSTPLGS